jgi:methylated-DNA-[protein]-cysteine S-methyltransferase
MKSIFFYETELGKIGIREDGGAITHVFFPGEATPKGAVVLETGLIKEASGQLQDYLAGRRKTWSLPLAPAGTEFMCRVWDELRAIPYGETRTYKEVADHAGNPNASRAVGLACNRNPIPLFIPCHRVIGSNGNLTGYRGGLTVKALLLNREKHHESL